MKKKLYQCSACNFLYQEKKWAVKCKAWCLKYQSCNLEIVKHAVKKSGPEKIIKI